MAIASTRDTCHTVSEEHRSRDQPSERPWRLPPSKPSENKHTNHIQHPSENKVGRRPQSTTTNTTHALTIAREVNQNFCDQRDHGGHQASTQGVKSQAVTRSKDTAHPYCAPPLRMIILSRLVQNALFRIKMLLKIEGRIRFDENLWHCDVT